MDLSNIASADIDRTDVGNDNLQIVVTLNLVGGGTFKRDFFLNTDTESLKNGTAQERAALQKQYVRRTIEGYLQSVQALPVRVSRGATHVNKAAFQEPGE